MEINLHVTFTDPAEFEAYCRNFLGQDVVLPAKANTAEEEEAPAPAAERPKRTRKSKKQKEAEAAAAAAVVPEPEPEPATETTDVTSVAADMATDDYTPDTTPKMEAADAPLDAKDVLTRYISVVGPQKARERIEAEGVKRVGQLPEEKKQEVLRAIEAEISLA